MVPVFGNRGQEYIAVGPLKTRKVCPGLTPKEITYTLCQAILALGVRCDQAMLCIYEKIVHGEGENRSLLIRFLFYCM